MFVKIGSYLKKLLNHLRSLSIYFWVVLFGMVSSSAEISGFGAESHRRAEKQHHFGVQTKTQNTNSLVLKDCTNQVICDSDEERAKITLKLMQICGKKALSYLKCWGTEKRSYSSRKYFSGMKQNFQFLSYDAKFTQSQTWSFGKVTVNSADDRMNASVFICALHQISGSHIDDKEDEKNCSIPVFFKKNSYQLIRIYIL